MNPEKVDHKLNTTQIKILALLKQDSSLTVIQLSEKLSLSQQCIKKNEKILKDLGYVERVSSKKQAIGKY
ncbi:MAG: winged helix-turn-helix transcriptional regulator [Clostridia bacterium]|nr:winged helix-turn-helix transcriptional regulator [Clostridia bacterium]